MSHRFFGLGAVVVLACVCMACGGSGAPAGVGATTPSSVTVTRPPTVTSELSAQQPATGRAPVPSKPLAPVPAVTPSGRSSAVDQVQTLWPVGPATAWALVDLPNGTSQELLRTVDAGAAWANVTPPAAAAHPDDITFSGGFALDANDAWAVYGPVASGSVRTLSVTADGGLLWTGEGTLPLPDGCTVQFVDPQHGWCAWVGAAMGSSAVRLWRTVDGGRNWSPILDTQPGQTGSAQIPLDCDKTIGFTGATTGWVTTHCNGGPAPLYRTTDGGTAWAAANVTRPPGQLEAGDGFTGVPVVDGRDGAVAFAVDGVAPTTVIYRTVDAGASWQPITPPDPHRFWCVGIVTPTSWRLISKNTLLATDNAGATWQATTTNHDFGQPQCGHPIDFTTEQTAWFPYGGQLYRSSDGGTTWTNITARAR